MKIGFIGLGIMGEAMCRNVVKKHGDDVYCFDVDGGKRERARAFGAIDLTSNGALARKADVVISMVPKSEHVRAVYREILPFVEPGKIYIDMSTIDPSVSVEVAKEIEAKGGAFADAPVVKSRPAAEAGELGILVGCKAELYEKILPILSYMGKNIVRMGENGMGLAMKICHNALVAEIQNGVNETLLLAKKAGIAAEDFARAISYGGGQNFYLDGQWKKLEAEDFSTAFSLENMHKDLGIGKRLAADLDLDLPGLNNAYSVYEKGMKAGIGGEDFRATYKIVRGDCDA